MFTAVIPRSMVRIRPVRLPLAEWPSGLRRWFKAPVSSGAWVRIPLRTPFFRRYNVLILVLSSPRHLSNMITYTDLSDNHRAHQETVHSGARFDPLF